MNTKEAILAQITENTGIALCDSGGTNGRHWQRNAGKTFEDLAWGEKTEAYVYTHGPVPKLEIEHTVALASYMENNLLYRADIQEVYQAFAEEHRDLYDMQIMEAFAAEYGAEARGVSYSYNWENILSQDIQFIVFEYEGDQIALVQTHNGCDARGGMSSPKAYEVLGDHCLGNCITDGYGCESQQWEEDGTGERSNLFDLPVCEFKYESRLLQDLENLALTDKNTPETQALMRKTDSETKELDFQIFCDELEDISVVVKDRIAYYVDGYPEQIYASSYALGG